MSTSYSGNLGLGTPASNDTGWATVLDRNRAILDALTPIGALAVRAKEYPSASLNVAVSAGSFVNWSGVLVTYAGTPSQAIPSGGTAYVYLTDSGTLTVGTAWPTAGTHFVPLAIVVAGATTITSVTDARVACKSVSQ